MNSFHRRIELAGILILDGAWGTQLAERGLPAGVAPESWNLEKPETVLQVPAAYVEAGADIVLTNTFGGNRYKLEKSGLADRVAEVNRRGVRISREAAGDDALVFASIGPTGEFMEPLGTLGEGDMVEIFAEQVAAMREAGADGIVVETMTDLGEAMAALKAVKDNSDLPCCVCLTYDKGARGYATMMGVRPAQAATELTDAGADAIGTNCGAGIDNMVEVVELLRPATPLPIWAKPNAGMPELVGGKTVFRETPEQMASKLERLVEAGAQLVGGCCGTTPDHIRALVARRDDLRG